MINIYCACQQQSTFHERMAGQTVTCDACGGTLHLVCGETLRDAAGEGDFDAALDMEGKAGSPATRYLLGGVSELQIGRLPDRQIVLPNQDISRQHCKLVRIDFGPSRWKIVDQKSALGVYVNEQRVTEHELQDGDKIQIGTNTFYYVLEGADLVEIDPQDDDESPAEPFYAGLSTAGSMPFSSHENAIGEDARSGARADKKRYAILSVAAVITLAILVFFVTRFSKPDQSDSPSAVKQHSVVAMNSPAGTPVATINQTQPNNPTGAEANNQTPDVPESPPAGVGAPTAMSPPPTQVNNFQPPGQAAVNAVPRRSLRWRPVDSVAQASPDDAATARFSNNIPRHISHRSKHSSDEPALPEGMSKTEIIGLDGGGPYLRVSSTRQPVIGFTIKIGSWGHTTIGSAEPLFAKPGEKLPDDTTACVAKDGYVVGGVIVNSIDGADGLCIIFMKKTRNGVDPADSYNSQWFGYTGDGTQTQLDGKGKLIIGTIGRQGMNMNKIGLVIDNTGSG